MKTTEAGRELAAAARAALDALCGLAAAALKWLLGRIVKRIFARRAKDQQQKNQGAA